MSTIPVGDLIKMRNKIEISKNFIYSAARSHDAFDRDSLKAYFYCRKDMNSNCNSHKNSNKKSSYRLGSMKKEKNYINKCLSEERG